MIGKFGRKAPVAPAPALKLRHFLASVALPAAPPAVHWNRADYKGLGDILANDSVGDCTCAAMMHAYMIWTRNNVQTPDPDPTAADTLALYSKITGYDPSNPASDTGSDLPVVLAYAKANGLFPSGRGKIAGWVAVDATDAAEVRFAIWAFGALYLGLGLPDAWTQNEPQANGFVWDKAGLPNQSSGHCILAVGYNENEVIVDTWGLIGGVTNNAFSYYMSAAQQGECYAILTEDWLDRVKKIAPSGFAYDQLANYLAAL